VKEEFRPSLGAACTLHERPVYADLLTSDLGSIEVVNRRLGFFERIVLNQRVALTQRKQGGHRSHFACTVCARPSPPAVTEWSRLLLRDVIAASTLQCIVHGEENPQNCRFPLKFCHPAGRGPSHNHRQMHRIIGKDRTCGSGDILADRQTHTNTHTQTCSSRYFTTTPTGPFQSLQPVFGTVCRSTSRLHRLFPPSEAV